MLGLALTYLLLVKVAGDPTLVRGWAIPAPLTSHSAIWWRCRCFGRSHPVLPFLLLLAIADDAFGLIILAVFYPVRAVHPALVLGLVGLAAAAALVMRRRKVKSFWPYILIGGSLAWGGLFVGGLHPALALVPVVPFLPHAAHDAGPLVQEPAAHDTLNEFGRWWRKPVQIILFAFGLPMPGFPFERLGRRPGRSWERSWQGSHCGIGLAVAVAAVAGFHLPPRMTWRDVLIAGSTAGIGFTVALFFATAAFPDGRTLDEAKLGALLSVGSAGLAFWGRWCCGPGDLRLRRRHVLDDEDLFAGFDEPQLAAGDFLDGGGIFLEATGLLAEAGVVATLPGDAGRELLVIVSGAEHGQEPALAEQPVRDDQGRHEDQQPVDDLAIDTGCRQCRRLSSP